MGAARGRYGGVGKGARCPRPEGGTSAAPASRRAAGNAKGEGGAAFWQNSGLSCLPSPAQTMSHADIRSAVRPDPDQAMVDIADYVVDFEVTSTEALDTARYMLLDSLGCAMLAMKHPECVKHLGPLVPGATLPGGARVTGTPHELDPVQAAYNIGVQVRWLDFNDTWLAAEWGHPSDNLGAILAVTDFVSRRSVAEGKKPLSVRDLITAMIKAHEIQGVLAL